MIEEPDFYTITMAKIYVSQGYLEKAYKVYTHLLEHEPDRRDLADALNEVQKKLSEKEKKRPGDLVSLCGKWIDLMFRYNRLQKLKQIKNRLNSHINGSFHN